MNNYSDKSELQAQGYKPHHIWCNHAVFRDGACKMCDGLYKKYPMDASPDEMMKKHFPDAIKLR